MKKHFLINLALVILCSSSEMAYSQDLPQAKFYRFQFYPELLTIAPDYNEFPLSANVEMTVNKKNTMSIRLGFWPDFSSNFISVPLTFVWITRPYSKHHLEMAAGPAIHFDYYYLRHEDPYGPDRLITEFYPDCWIGYRYQKPYGRFAFRALAHVFLGWPTIISPGFGVGYRF